MRIGIDFDNTLAGYDTVFAEVAIRERLIRSDAASTKREVKQHLLDAPGGKEVWMGLQGRVYGAYMNHAILITGVASFLNRCRTQGVEVFVISHKTQFGHFDPDQIDLREAARSWMTDKNFFNPDGFALSPDNISFSTTREEKIARIKDCAVTHFIDDLSEVLDHPDFPPHVKTYYFSPPDQESLSTRHHHYATWAAIEDKIFNQSMQQVR